MPHGWRKSKQNLRKSEMKTENSLLDFGNTNVIKTEIKQCEYKKRICEHFKCKTFFSSVESRKKRLLWAPKTHQN